MSAFPPRTTHNSQLTTAFLVLSYLLLTSGCAYDDEQVSTCIEEGEASGTIPVYVSCRDPQTQPLYFWDGEDAFVVEVARTSDPDHAVWQVTSTTLPNMNGIKSPVIHGERPANAAITNEEEPYLAFDVEYQVKVLRSGGEFGSRKFTIQP